MAALDESTTGNLVDRLDRLGCISATVDPTNRRRKFVRITDSGDDNLRKPYASGRTYTTG
jgi:DNA-binding MarR family transcriptional regulator